MLLRSIRWWAGAPPLCAYTSNIHTHEHAVGCGPSRTAAVLVWPYTCLRRVIIVSFVPRLAGPVPACWNPCLFTFQITLSHRPTHFRRKVLLMLQFLARILSLGFACRSCQVSRRLRALLRRRWREDARRLYEAWSEACAKGRAEELRVQEMEVRRAGDEKEGRQSLFVCIYPTSAVQIPLPSARLRTGPSFLSFFIRSVVKAVFV